MYLSQTSLKDIRTRILDSVAVDGEVAILYENGFWYGSIPQYVEPELYASNGSCIALGPGIKTFHAGVNLNGNVIEFACGNQRCLNTVGERQAAVQSVIDEFEYIKKMRGRAWRWEYREYARAKRAFHSCTVNFKHLVKDLHYETCCYLTYQYNTILLPRFQTQSLFKRSSARNHGLNRCILSLNHYRFCQMLAAKCAVKGNTLIECSEMYTSQTCGGCNRLHTSLGKNDIFCVSAPRLQLPSSERSTRLSTSCSLQSLAHCKFSPGLQRGVKDIYSSLSPRGAVLRSHCRF